MPPQSSCHDHDATHLAKHPFSSALASAMAQYVILGHARYEKSNRFFEQGFSGSKVCGLVFGLRTFMAAREQQGCSAMHAARFSCAATLFWARACRLYFSCISISLPESPPACELRTAREHVLRACSSGLLGPRTAGARSTRFLHHCILHITASCDDHPRCAFKPQQWKLLQSEGTVW